MSDENNQHERVSIYKEHEGAMLSGVGVLVFVLCGAVITNFVSTEREKDRSKAEDQKAQNWEPKIEKIDAIETTADGNREWLRAVNAKNVSQLQMINDLKADFIRLQEQSKCIERKK